MKKIVLLLMAVILCLSSSAQKVYKVYQDCGQTFNEDLTQPTGTENGHEWVDLGLSVKWASKNVGASTIGDYGGYYEMPIVKTGIIPLTSDIARKYMGGSWRTPSRKECQELIENCNVEYILFTQDIYGVKFTSKINGNSIFIPNAGRKSNGSILDAGKGIYQTSDLSEVSSETSSDWWLYKSKLWMLYLQTNNSVLINAFSGARDMGGSYYYFVSYLYTIRAVCD